jgi:hypothetical protein
MPRKARHLLNSQISCYSLLLTLLTCCATNISNNLNFYMTDEIFHPLSKVYNVVVVSSILGVEVLWCGVKKLYRV